MLKYLPVEFVIEKQFKGVEGSSDCLICGELNSGSRGESVGHVEQGGDVGKLFNRDPVAVLFQGHRNIKLGWVYSRKSLFFFLPLLQFVLSRPVRPTTEIDELSSILLALFRVTKFASPLSERLAKGPRAAVRVGDRELAARSLAASVCLL